MSDPKETLRRVEALLDRCERWDRETGIGDLVTQTIHQERAAVVAWLRGRAERMMAEDAGVTAYVVQYFADSIERGEHCREEEP